MNWIKNRYVYKEFEDEPATHPIRLLRLHPSALFSAKIECELFNTTLEGKNNFEALSYTWGNPKDTLPMVLSGQRHYITKNLETALRHMRYSDRERILWVDALCINQGDIEERNQQVTHMQKIYNPGGAWRVVVWLGNVPNLDFALAFCTEVQRLKDAGELHLADFDNEIAPAVCEELFVKPLWWSRAWILQEVIHSGNVVVCVGTNEPVPIDRLCEAYTAYQSWKMAKEGHADRFQRLPNGELAPNLLPPKRVPLQQQFNLWVRATDRAFDVRGKILDLRTAARNPSAPGGTSFPKRYLSGLLMDFRDRQATDPLDLVYAYLGLAAPGSNGTDIRVDYHLSKKDLYRKLARRLLKNGLAILLWVEAPSRPVEKKPGGLPSWVPDYTTQQTITGRHMRSFTADLGFPPIKKKPQCQETTDLDILALRGIYVGIITEVTHARLTDLPEFKGRDIVKLIKYDKDPESRHRPPMGYGAIIVWGLKVISLATLYIVMNKILWPIISRLMYHLFLRYRSVRRPYYRYLAAKTLVMSGTSWGPCHAAVGDVIIVAAGSRVPLALRPTGTCEYLLVGGCWLIDSTLKMNKFWLHEDNEAGFSPIMFGSACRDLKEDWEAEEFRIC